MDTSKFSQLLNKLEAQVVAAEHSNDSQEPNSLLNRFEGLVQRLEHLQSTGGSMANITAIPTQVPVAPAQPAQAAPAQAAKPTPQATAAKTPVPAGAAGVEVIIQKFKDQCFVNIENLLKLTKEINVEQLTEGVNLYLEMLRSQEASFKTMAACKKPDDDKFMVALAKENKNKMMKLERPGRKVMTHLRCLEDSVNIFAWFMLPENKSEFNDTFGDFFGNIDFNGSKLVAEDPPINKTWYQAFRKVHQDFYNFIKGQFPSILKWKGTNADAESFYKNALGSLGQAATPAAPAKEEAKKEEKKAAPVKAAPAKAAPKPPSKILKFKTWEICNYGAETLKFPASEVNAGMTFNFFNCEKTKIIIEGKCKNIMLSRCKKVDIQIEGCMTGTEVIKSENIKIYAMGKIPTIAIEVCNAVQIIATEESKTQIQVLTTASQSVSLTFPKKEGTYNPDDEEDDDTALLVIPETWASKVDANDKLNIVAQEGID